MTLWPAESQRWYPQVEGVISLARERAYRRALASAPDSLYRLSVQPRALGAFIRFLREQRGLEPAEAARRAGIKGSGRWYELEAGEQSTKAGKKPTRPSVEVALGIADGLDLSDEETRQLLELAGYGDIWRSIGSRAARLRGEVQTLEEALRGRGLTGEERKEILNHIRGLEALKGSQREAR